MIPLQEILKSVKSSPVKKSSERADLLGQFLAELNKDRGKFKPITPRQLGVKLAHIKTKDLYCFLSQCKQARNFGKYFWWALKP